MPKQKQGHDYDAAAALLGIRTTSSPPDSPNPSGSGKPDPADTMPPLGASSPAAASAMAAAYGHQFPLPGGAVGMVRGGGGGGPGGGMPPLPGYQHHPHGHPHRPGQALMPSGRGGTASSAAAAAAPKSRKDKFPVKLMEILTTDEYIDSIAWLPHGRSFIIHSPERFTATVLPKYFKECKFSSFTRKLYRWGFRQISKGPDAESFFHKHFRRDKKTLCNMIVCGKEVRDGCPELHEGINARSLMRMEQAELRDNLIQQRQEALARQNLARQQALFSQAQAAAVAAQTNHPRARAIVGALSTQDLDVLKNAAGAGGIDPARINALQAGILSGQEAQGQANQMAAQQQMMQQLQGAAAPAGVVPRLAPAPGGTQGSQVEAPVPPLPATVTAAAPSSLQPAPSAEPAPAPSSAAAPASAPVVGVGAGAGAGAGAAATANGEAAALSPSLPSTLANQVGLGHALDNQVGLGHALDNQSLSALAAANSDPIDVQARIDAMQARILELKRRQLAELEAKHAELQLLEAEEQVRLKRQAAAAQGARAEALETQIRLRQQQDGLAAAAPSSSSAALGKAPAPASVQPQQGVLQPSPIQTFLPPPTPANLVPPTVQQDTSAEEKQKGGTGTSSTPPSLAPPSVEVEKAPAATVDPALDKATGSGAVNGAEGLPKITEVPDREGKFSVFL